MPVTSFIWSCRPRFGGPKAGVTTIKHIRRTVVSEFSDLVLEIYRAAREQPIDQFQDFVLALLRAWISFDSSRWLTAEIIGKRATALLVHLHNEPYDTVQAWEAINHHDSYKDIMV